VVEIVRVGPTDEISTVWLQSEDLSARAGTDFESVEMAVEFPRGVSSVTVPLKIHDNRIEDSDRSFKLQLAPVLGSTVGIRNELTVRIKNDDFRGKVSLPASEFVLFEDEGFLDLKIRRLGGDLGNIPIL